MLTSLLLGRWPPRYRDHPLSWALWIAGLSLPAFSLIGLVGTVAQLRRWRSRPELRPRGRWRLARALALPLTRDVAFAASLLVVLPRLFGVTLPLMMPGVPDLTLLLIVSSSAVLLGGVLRTGVGLRLAIAARRPTYGV